MRSPNRFPLQIALAASALALGALPLPPAQAAVKDGTLDKTFRQTGKAVFTVPGENLSGEALEVRSDGKIVILASQDDFSGTLPTGDILLGRLRTDGTVDETFGSLGWLRSDLGGRWEIPRAVRVQADQKVVVSGTALDLDALDGPAEAFLARYLPDGGLDTTFAAPRGYVFFGAGLLDDANVLTIQKDGKLLVTGSTTDLAGTTRLLLVRRLKSGQPDTTFGPGHDGLVSALIEGRPAFGFGLAVQTDGKIVVGGFVGDAATLQPFLARFLANGLPDTSFGGGDGTVILDDATQLGSGSLVAVQKDGKILLGGERHAPNGLSGEWAVFRRLATGAPDTAFGVGGTAKIDFGPGRDGGSGLLLTKSGKIVVAGSTRTTDSTGLGGPIGLARLKPDGKLDPTFGSGGKQTFTLAPTGSALTWALLQKDGKILTLDRFFVGGHEAMAVTRHVVAPSTARVPVP
jgi:uncharacterized delta-60 repeat protein